MAVELLNDVAEISWSKNPIRLNFESNLNVESQGKAFVVFVGFEYSSLSNFIGPVEGEILALQMYELNHTFTFKNNPILGQNELPVYNNSISVDLWFENLRSHFLSNSYVGDYYDIDITPFIYDGNTEYISFGAKPYLRFTSKDRNTLANIDFTVRPTLLVVERKSYAQDIIYRKNLKIYAELWVYDGFQKRKLMSVNIPADLHGKATWDISIPLHNYAELNYNTQEASSGIVRYYFNFTDVYGNNQVVGNTLNSADKYVLFGGVPSCFLGETVVASLIRENSIKWLANHSLKDVVLVRDQEYLLTLFNPNISYSNVKVCFNLHYENFINKELVVDTINLPSKSKIYVNPLKDVLFSYSSDTLLYWEIYLKKDNQIISEKSAFRIDSSYAPFLRHLKYFNSFGAISFLNIYGKGNNSYDIDNTKADILNSNGVPELQDTSISIRNKEVLRTGYKSKQEIESMRDFFLSKEKHLKVGDRWQAILVKTSAIKEFEDGNNLYALEFEIEWAVSDNVWGYK